MSAVRHIGIDETSLRKGHNYITVVHDLDAKRLLFATEGRDHETVHAFAQDLQAHQGDPAKIEHVCQDMSGASLQGVSQAGSSSFRVEVAKVGQMVWGVSPP